MHPRQPGIIASLHVTRSFAAAEDVAVETRRRIDFIKDALRNSGLRSLVLGISGGVDSLVAGRMAQLAVEQLRAEHKGPRYRFIALRLPYRRQHDEADARAALDFIGADHVHYLDIAASVDALGTRLGALGVLPDARRDPVRGNIKARMRMVAQFAVANALDGLVIGTDHAAEAVLGFFTKFGDGACDLAPLSGLVKAQVRRIARHLGAPAHLVDKVPTADLEDACPGRPDELAHGISYVQIDAFLLGQDIDPRVAQRIVASFDASRHKRELPLSPAPRQP